MITNKDFAKLEEEYPDIETKVSPYTYKKFDFWDFIVFVGIPMIALSYSIYSNHQKVQQYNIIKNKIYQQEISLNNKIDSLTTLNLEKEHYNLVIVENEEKLKELGEQKKEAFLKIDSLEKLIVEHKEQKIRFNKEQERQRKIKQEQEFLASFPRIKYNNSGLPIEEITYEYNSDYKKKVFTKRNFDYNSDKKVQKKEEEILLKYGGFPEERKIFIKEGPVTRETIYKQGVKIKLIEKEEDSYKSLQRRTHFHKNGNIRKIVEIFDYNLNDKSCDEINTIYYNYVFGFLTSKTKVDKYGNMDFFYW